MAASAVAVIGAGFGGLALAHRLAQAGIDDVVLFERDGGVGGTWRSNHYPGAACDVPAHLYSLSFAPNPRWSRSYAGQPEILRYVEDCYDRFDVRRKVRFRTEIVAAHWSEDDSCWRVRDRDGGIHEARILVSAVGLFNTFSLPAIPGLELFEGTMFHSARWDHDHNLSGRNVAVVGTGASAIQVVPAIVEQVSHLDLYQRSAPWILPRKNLPYSPEQQQRFAIIPEEALSHREELHDRFEQVTTFVAGDPTAAFIADIARSYLERKVADPDLRAKLTPDQPFGCKRTLVSSDYYPAVQREHVELITDRIECITPSGVQTADGTERPVETIVLCTGFRAPEYLRGMEVVGLGGTTLSDQWAGVPRAYHGMAVPGFPNFFMLYGPNTNQGGNSILLILEAQSQFVASALDAMSAAGAETIEVTRDAMTRYSEQLERDLQETIWVNGCTGYFFNATGDVVTQLPHTSGWYRDAVREIVTEDFAFGSAGRVPTRSRKTGSSRGDRSSTSPAG